MAQAAEAEAAALVIQIDTPGGLDTSMRDIIQAEIDSPIPIVFYVYPQGARAASAGVYILMGSDVAAMAPQTNLGAATPVSLNGDMDETMQAKVTNDAAAYIKGLATTHGRNADVGRAGGARSGLASGARRPWSRTSSSSSPPIFPAFYEAIDGYVTTPKNLTLHTAGAPVNEVGMGWVKRFLHAIANPDIAYILMTIGVLGIILEFCHARSGRLGRAGSHLPHPGVLLVPGAPGEPGRHRAHRPGDDPLHGRDQDPEPRHPRRRRDCGAHRRRDCCCSTPRRRSSR